MTLWRKNSSHSFEKGTPLQAPLVVWSLISSLSMVVTMCTLLLIGSSAQTNFSATGWLLWFAAYPKANFIIWHFRLFKEAFKEEYGDLSPTDLTKQVLQSVERLNGEGVIRIKAEQSNGQLVIAFVTPIMLRVHKKLKHSGELVFMDATGTLDRFNHRVFLLMTHSPAGGLPLGCIVTSSESLQTIEHALALFKDLLDDECFYGRGTRGQLFH